MSDVNRDSDYYMAVKVILKTIHVLKEACSLFNVYISAYCLMSNYSRPNSDRIDSQITGV